MKILTIDMHPSVGSQLNYSVESWKWGKDMIELKLDNGKIVQINPAYVIALIHAEVDDEEGEEIPSVEEYEDRL